MIQLPEFISKFFFIENEKTKFSTFNEIGNIVTQKTNKQKSKFFPLEQAKAIPMPNSKKPFKEALTHSLTVKEIKIQQDKLHDVTQSKKPFLDHVKSRNSREITSKNSKSIDHLLRDQKTFDYAFLGDLTFLEHKTFEKQKFLENFGLIFNFIDKIKASSFYKYYEFLFSSFELIMFLINLSFLVIIPLQIGFENNFIGTSLKNYSIFSIMCFILDILLNYSISSKKFHLEIKIIVNFSSIIYIMLSIFDIESQILGFLFLSKFSIISKFTKKIFNEYLNQIHSFFLVTFLKALIISHIYTCIWVYISDLHNNSNEWNLHYLKSFYEIISVMTLNGFPENNNLKAIQKLTIIIICYSSFFLLFYVLFEMVKNVQNGEKITSKSLQNMNSYLKNNKVDCELSARVKRFFKQGVKLEKKEKSAEKFLEILPNSLKLELIQQSNFSILTKIPFLSNNFSKNTLLKLAKFMKETKFQENESIMDPQKLNDPCLFIVKSGEVLLYLNPKKPHSRFLKELGPNNSFNEEKMFGNIEKTKISAISKGTTKILSLKISDFLNILRENSEDYEKYCKMRDQIMFYQNFDDIKCVICNKSFHIDCPYITPNLNLPDLLYKNQIQTPQKRKKFARKPRKFNKNALSVAKQLEKVYLKLNNNNTKDQKDIRKTVEDDSIYDSQSDFDLEKGSPGVNRKRSQSNEYNGKFSMNEFTETKSVGNNLSNNNGGGSGGCDEFEKMRSYYFYFPENNVEKACEVYNLKRKRVFNMYCVSKEDFSLFSSYIIERKSM